MFHVEHMQYLLSKHLFCWGFDVQRGTYAIHGGPYRDRTGYLFHAMEALYQVS